MCKVSEIFAATCITNLGKSMKTKFQRKSSRCPLLFFWPITCTFFRFFVYCFSANFPRVFQQWFSFRFWQTSRILLYPKLKIPPSILFPFLSFFFSSHLEQLATSNPISRTLYQNISSSMLCIGWRRTLLLSQFAHNFHQYIYVDVYFYINI